MKCEEKTSDSKLTSRKFAVWIVWLLLTVGILIYSFFRGDSSILVKALDSFFFISMMYLGMNVGQKVGFAVADALTKHKDSEEEEDE